MICKHCGYDVPRGIDYCTNCGEKMPKEPKTAETPQETVTPERTDLTKKEFTKDYVPRTARLCIITGAIMSYFYSALYLFISIGGIVLLKNASAVDIAFLIISVILLALTFGFHLKKSLLCAIGIDVISIVFSIYCLALFHQLTIIWICAGFLATYGTAKHSKLWSAYKKTGILPKKID